MLVSLLNQKKIKFPPLTLEQRDALIGLEKQAETFDVDESDFENDNPQTTLHKFSYSFPEINTDTLVCLTKLSHVEQLMLSFANDNTVIFHIEEV